MPLFKTHLYTMAAYEPPLEGRSAQEHLLLDFNERTLPVSDEVADALCHYIRAGSLQKYPAYGDINEKIAGYVGAKSDQVIITNGSDQGIDLVIRAAVSDGDTVIIPGPSFAMYQQIAEVENAQVLSPRYDIERGYPVDEVIASVNADTRLIVVPLPNNPCGSVVSIPDLERILSAAPQAVVLVDECYYEYSGLTAVDLIETYPNLVIARTFSKTWGLPSLRFGFLISQAENIRQLLKIRGPYDVNQLAVVAVEAALKNSEYTLNYVHEVMTESKPILESWLRNRNIVFWQSQANYLWTFPPQPQALAKHLQQQAILVRPKTNDQGELGLRITLGNRAQTICLIEALDAFYGNE